MGIEDLQKAYKETTENETNRKTLELLRDVISAWNTTNEMIESLTSTVSKLEDRVTKLGRMQFGGKYVS